MIFWIKPRKEFDHCKLLSLSSLPFDIIKVPDGCSTPLYWVGYHFGWQQCFFSYNWYVLEICVSCEYISLTALEIYFLVSKNVIRIYIYLHTAPQPGHNCVVILLPFFKSLLTLLEVDLQSDALSFPLVQFKPSQF